MSQVTNGREKSSPRWISCLLLRVPSSALRIRISALHARRQSIERHQQLIPFGNDIERLENRRVVTIEAPLADADRVAKLRNVGHERIIGFVLAQKRQRLAQRAMGGPDRRTSAVAGLQDHFEAAGLKWSC